MRAAAEVTVAPKPFRRRPAPRGTALALFAASLFVAGRALAACEGSDLLQSGSGAPALIGEVDAAARDLPYGHGTFFRLTKPGLPDSYLLGTLHLSDPRTTDFPAVVLAALDGARILLTEIALEDGTRGRPTGRVLLDRTGRGGATHLNRSDFAELRRRLIERGIPARAARRFRAGVLALLIDLPACARTAGDDYAEARLVRRARTRGIALAGLESLNEQIEVVSDLPIAVEGDLLRAVLHQARRGPDIAETTIARYKDGETGRLLAWMRTREPVPEDPLSRVPSMFLDRLLDLRSARMADRLRSYLASGNTFIAVGAAHLPGEAGLLKRLDGYGYQVTAVR